MPNGPEFKGFENIGALSDELERQASIYEGLGVNKDIIMRLVAPRPNGLPEKLNIPVVTLGSSVDLGRQLSFAEIWPQYLDPTTGFDTSGGITLESPHLIWMQDGEENLGKSVAWVRAHLKVNERPATLTDGIAFATVHSDIRGLLNKHQIHFPGTSIAKGNAPFLMYYRNELCLSHYFINTTIPNWGPATSGG